MLDTVRIETHLPDFGDRGGVLLRRGGIAEEELGLALGSISFHWHYHRRSNK